MTRAENKFGKVSEFKMKAEASSEHQTRLTEVSFTAPYKIMQPFPQADGSIEVCLLSASAGIMEGDQQYFELDIASGASVKFTTQAYEKIHEMNYGEAQRQAKITVAENGKLIYFPHPCIPFAKSAFTNVSTVYLENDSKLYYVEIFTCGRYMRGELFKYRYYHNRVNIYRNDKLIYRDNTHLEPSKMPLQGLGFFEDYTHMANILVTKEGLPEDFTDRVLKLLITEGHIFSTKYEDLEHEAGSSPKQYSGCITQLASGDYFIRVMASRGEVLEALAEEILKYTKWTV